MAFSTEEDLAYMAGLFDGEGYVGITPYDGKRRHLLRVNITNACRSVLDWIVSVYGGSIYSDGHGKRKEVYQWCMYGADAFGFLLDISKYLRIKNSQVEVALEFQVSKHNYHGSGPAHKYWSEGELKFQEQCYDLIKELKEAG